MLAIAEEFLLTVARHLATKTATSEVAVSQSALKTIRYSLSFSLRSLGWITKRQ